MTVAVTDEMRAAAIQAGWVECIRQSGNSLSYAQSVAITDAVLRAVGSHTSSNARPDTAADDTVWPDSAPPV